MDATVRDFLDSGGIVDITTTGRSTGLPRRIEIRLHNIDGEIFITAAPGKRSWYANMMSNPRFTIHIKGEPGFRGLDMNVMAMAHDVSDSDIRNDVIPRMVAKANLPGDPGDRIKSSVLVRADIDEL
jgi:hypothetical protein